MDDLKKYWRDRVLDLFKWGTAVFILFIGWGAGGNYKIFKIGKGSRDQDVAGFGLLIITIAYTILMPMAVNYIYNNHLDKGIDKTVLPRNFAMWCAGTIAVLTLIVAILMVFV